MSDPVIKLHKLRTWLVFEFFGAFGRSAIKEN